MRDLLADQRLTAGAMAALLGLFALLGAPHLWHLSPLLMAIFYGGLLWRALALSRPRLLPGKLLRALLTFGALAMVGMSVAGQLDGRALGVGLLTVMSGLKALELRSRRDLYVMVFLGCFLLATQFLFDRGLWMNLYLAPWLVGLLGLLAYCNRAQPPGWRRAGLDAGRLLLAALPMTVLLFVLFPRLPGPLWGIRSPAAGVTGLTDRLELGNLSQLGLSQAIAFRVSFADGKRPAPSELYWRGPVFWDTDGRTWRAAESGPSAQAGPSQGQEWVQEVTLEPSNQHWLFALDRPLAAPAGARLSRDGQLLTTEPVRQRRNYQVVSRRGAGEAQLSATERARALALPAGMVTARMQTLAEQWLAADPRPAAVVQAALGYFHTQPFVYTLTPPPLSGNAVDSFLFDTRQGFCEHFATSFTVLMRAAGIPARMVGGYQGGEWNPRGGHLVVRQSDAHAWAEVWLGDHWQRVDPTAAVAPERIQRPIDVTAAAQGGPVIFQTAAPGWWARTVREGGWLLDSMELGWQRWVVGYTDRTQAGLLSRLGLSWLTGYRLGLATVIAAGLALLPLWWLLRRAPRQVLDPAQRAYRRLQGKLGRAGLTLSPSLAPTEMARRAGARFPDQRIAIDRIIGLYLTLRYGPRSDRQRLRRLDAMVRALRLSGRRASQDSA